MASSGDPGVCSGCSERTGDVMPREVGTSRPVLCSDCADRRRALSNQGQTRATAPPDAIKRAKGGEP